MNKMAHEKLKADQVGVLLQVGSPVARVGIPLFHRSSCMACVITGKGVADEVQSLSQNQMYYFLSWNRMCLFQFLSWNRMFLS